MAPVARIGLGALIALLVSAIPVSAQGAQLAPQDRARLEREMERLGERMAAMRILEARTEAAANRQAEQALRHIQEGGVTETFGPVVVRRPSTAPSVASRVEAILSDYRMTVGELDGPDRLTIGLYLREDLGPIPPADLGGDGTIWHRHSDRGLARMESDIRSYILFSIPGPTTVWSGGSGWGADYDPLYALRAMAHVTELDGVECLHQGDVEACARFMSVDHDLSGVTRPGRTRRRTQTETRTGREASMIRTPLRQCIAEGAGVAIMVDDPRSACLRNLPRISGGADPLRERAIRGSLVAYAIHRGGGGALEKLTPLPSDATVARQLEAISGLPIDELLGAWRADAMNGQGMFDGVGGNPPGPVSLLWAGGFAVLALTSTRWRLG